MQLGDALRYSSGACDALGQPVQGKGLPEFVFCPRVELSGIFTAGAATLVGDPHEPAETHDGYGKREERAEIVVVRLAS